MFRRPLLRAALLAPWVAPLVAPLLVPRGATAQTGPAALTERDRADLARVEAYLNGLTTLKARFLQIAQNGAAAEGTAWISRPGRMRFEYDPPEPLLLVASSGQFLYYDRAMRQTTVAPIGSTPLGFLLRANLRFGGEIAISRVERTGGFLRVTMFRAAAPAEGRLTLVFAENPMELRQWSVVDAQARETRVSLYSPEVGGRFDGALFEFNDPRFQEDLGHR